MSVRWKKSKELHEFKDGEVISQVPLTHEAIITSNSVMEAKTDKWLKEVDEIIESFDRKLFHPIYYCKKCQWIENGGHRIAVAHKIGRKSINVEIHDECISPDTWIHSYRGTWIPPWMREENLELISPLVELVHKLFADSTGIKSGRDHDLIEHSALKWKTIKELVDFTDKKVIDFGCHSGLIPLEVARSGARYVIGTDIREDVIISAEAIALFTGTNNIEFMVKKICDISYVENIAEVVMCLGVLHKFKPDEYIERINRLCYMAAETLVIDVLVIYDNEDKTVVKHDGGKWPIRTQVTVKWLTNRLADFGFKVTDRVRSEKFPERAIWVAKNTNVASQ